MERILAALDRSVIRQGLMHQRESLLLAHHNTHFRKGSTPRSGYISSWNRPPAGNLVEWLIPWREQAIRGSVGSARREASADTGFLLLLPPGTAR